MRFVYVFYFIVVSQLFGEFSASPKNIEFPPQEDGFKAFGEFLYWKTMTDPLPYAVTYLNQTLPASVGGTTIPNHTTFESVEFGYDPGFRIGALYEGSSDLWDAGITWTQFAQTGISSVAVNAPEELNILWEVTLSPANIARAVQNQHFTNIDFEIGRTWRVTDYFSLRGALAAELAWLSEELNITYLGIVNNNDFRTNNYVILENDCSGVGGAMNIKTNYYIGYGFSFYGLGKIALYTATVNIKNQEEMNIIDQDTNVLTPIYLLRQNTLINMKSNFVINLGGEWGRQILPMMGLKVALAYEFNYWPNQIGLLQLIYDKDTQAVIINQFSDVSFQGITLRGALNF